MAGVQVPLLVQDDRDGDPIPISALQHAVYCLRQAALIHLERLWEENLLTAQGHILHVSTDTPHRRRIKGVRCVHSLPVGSRALGVAGVADMVEFHSDGRCHPVEYKRGKTKLHRADEVQLCAQALCLEEMTGRSVPTGSLFYAETRRRQEVAFDDDLKSLTRQTINQLRDVFATRKTPPPPMRRDRCRACSLLSLCRPKDAMKPVRIWRENRIDRLISDSTEESVL